MRDPFLTRDRSNDGWRAELRLISGLEPTFNKPGVLGSPMFIIFILFILCLFIQFFIIIMYFFYFFIFFYFFYFFIILFFYYFIFLFFYFFPSLRPSHKSHIR